ncbi:MAG: hypothetical protein GWM90_24405, partial [Gemmatimonadetes bacterium]|nr:hypothetical protein [Gemmatimonadota bacterium]NIQ57901.1 hypothetical protein [Gemmatimonadota bacterium]NIU73270.1 hypothetical protein [Gammaproteobacteria bacterium]NIX47105.1 hypothetical protein [Gemmatimonadota bacterium]NIY07711.1 hypothetical protein [Gemmatimonadota bacterium]
QGHEGFGRYARDRGVNAARLLAPAVDEASGGPVWQQVRASIHATGRWERPPTASHQYTTQGRHEIVETVSLEEAAAAQPSSALAAMAAAAA